MSVDPSVLQAIWNKLDAAEEPLSEQDRENLALAKRSGQISIENSKRSAAIGGDADGAIIITGNNNTIKLPKNDYEAIAQINDPKRIELIKEVKTRVESLLEDYHSCDSGSMDINLEIQQNQVRPEWADNAPSRTIKNKILKTEEQIIKFFDDKNGRFLILGEAGSGKTVALLLIAKRLLKIAENNHRYVPLIVDAKSWQDRNEAIDKKEAVFEWLVLQLKEGYSFESKNVARKFLQENQGNIILLVDGLDSLELEQQRQMIKDINIFLLDFTMKMILCCRTSDYQRCRVLLRLNSAVHLQFLEETEICEYLKPAISSETWEIIRQDSNILEIIKTPLFLFQLRTVLTSESDTSFVEILQTKPYQNTKQLYCHLFDRYIEDSLKNNFFKKIPVSITRKWVVILARMMKEESKTEFLIEKMQPSWFKGIKKIKQRKEYQRLNGLIAFLISLPPAIEIAVLFDDGRFSESYFFPKYVIKFLSSAIICTASAIISYNTLEINLIETLGISFIKIKKSFFDIYIRWKEHILGAIFGNIVGTSTDEINQFVGNLKNSEIIIVIRSVIGTIFSSLITWISSMFHDSELEIEERSFANKGVFRSAFNAVILTILIGIFGFFAAAFIQYSTNNMNHLSHKNQYIVETGFIGLLSGIIVGILSVGLPCIQHFSLRSILYKHGYIPWNYARFLNHAAIKYKFMQRTGGSYRFVHPLLQEHFADMDIGENNT
jgi:NACHT domain